MTDELAFPGWTMGQVLLPDRFPSSTDILIETCGVLLGLKGMDLVRTARRRGVGLWETT